MPHKRLGPSVSATLMSWEARVQLRKLLEEYKKERASGDRDPNLLGRLRTEHFPELPPLNVTEAAPDLRDRMEALHAKRKQLDDVRAKLAALQSSKRDGGAGDAAERDDDDGGAWQ